jgi:exonuclease SbcC
LIEELTLQGFKSYRYRQTIRFTQGVNKISGRNASGKTTLLEALLFGLFGDVPGVNKQNLVPLGGGKLSVSVVFRSPLTGQKGRTLREGSIIARRKEGSMEEGFRSSKIYLEVEGEDHPYTLERDIQLKMRDLLGVGKNVFLNVVYARQKEFVDILNPQRNRMDAILGLTTPAEIREQLREVKRMLEERGRIGEKGAVEERIRYSKEALEECTSQLGEVKTRKAQLSEGMEEKKAELEVVRERVEASEELSEGFRLLEKQGTQLEVLEGLREQRYQDLQKLYEDLGESPEDRRAELQARRRSAEATEERLQLLVDAELGGERRTLDSEIALLTHQIGEHRELGEKGLTICPKCGQEIDYKVIEEDLVNWNGELEEKSKRLSILEREIEEINKQVKVVRENRHEAEKALDWLREQERRIVQLKKSIEDLDAQGANLNARLEKEGEELLQRTETTLEAVFVSLEDAQRKIDERLKVIRGELLDLREEVGSKEELIKELERQEGRISAQMEAHEGALEESIGLFEAIQEYEAKIGAVEGIQRQYGEYEQQLRENTLRQLEWLTYKYFERLTDQQVYSGCHIDRERYVLEVQPIGSRRLFPAWRAGGGHESLFALAERLALLRVMGFSHLLILDEPTDAVDSENVPQLLEYIARSSREIGQVLLVTHHGHGEEEGVNLIRVKKVDGESKVFQETYLE